MWRDITAARIPSFSSAVYKPHESLGKYRPIVDVVIEQRVILERITHRITEIMHPFRPKDIIKDF